MKSLYLSYKTKVSQLEDLPLLAIRLVLAYGFYHPALLKWKDMSSISEWFSGMGIPFPTVNAYLAATTEAAGVLLLFFGLGTRIISIPLIITMVVAIVTVHGKNGFEAGENGYEIPLYYIIMLFTLIVYGAGRLSVDYLINPQKRETNI